MFYIVNTFSPLTQEAVYKNGCSLWHENKDAEMFPKQNEKNDSFKTMAQKQVSNCLQIINNTLQNPSPINSWKFLRNKVL